MNALLTGLRHVKTTIGGLGSILAGLGLLAPLLIGISEGQPLDFDAIKVQLAAAAGLISTGISLLFAKDADKSNAPSPTAKPQTTPKGFASLALVLVLAVAALLALPARAQEAPEPRFGGCFGATCFAPTMNVNLLAMSLKTGELTPTFDPGPGYGVTFMSDKWHRVGVSVSASFPLYEGSRRVEPAVVVSFAEFARIGVSCPTYVAGGFSENARLLLSLGVNLWSW